MKTLITPGSARHRTKETAVPFGAELLSVMMAIIFSKVQGADGMVGELPVDSEP